jgi:hypothetical protein
VPVLPSQNSSVCSFKAFKRYWISLNWFLNNSYRLKRLSFYSKAIFF